MELLCVGMKISFYTFVLVPDNIVIMLRQNMKADGESSKPLKTASHPCIQHIEVTPSPKDQYSFCAFFS